MHYLLDLLFGCSHRKRSLPITLRKKDASGNGTPAETYLVCLECGKKFPYSWEEMRIVRPKKQKPQQPAEEHGLAAWFSRHRWSSRGM